MSPLEITLVILLVTIIAFVSGKVPFSVISTGIILALILTGIKTPAEAFGGFINTNVVMFVAMFVIGAGLTKTPLIDKAQSLVIRYKDNMRMLIFLSCVAGAFLGAITSATATAATAKYTVRIWSVSAAARNSRPNVQMPAIAATPVGKKTIENVLQMLQVLKMITWISVTYAVQMDSDPVHKAQVVPQDLHPVRGDGAKPYRAVYREAESAGAAHLRH